MITKLEESAYMISRFIRVYATLVMQKLVNYTLFVMWRLVTTRFESFLFPAEIAIYKTSRDEIESENCPSHS